MVVLLAMYTEAELDIALRSVRNKRFVGLEWLHHEMVIAYRGKCDEVDQLQKLRSRCFT